MSRTELHVGDVYARVLQDSLFWMDGGTLFHIVPKTLWSKKVEPDTDNLLPIGLPCLYLNADGKNILIDAGIGNRLPAKELEYYRIDPDHNLLLSMQAAGIAPESIDLVILTHLHLDHTGWLMHKDTDGNTVPTFPNARHLVQNAQWHAAHNTNELTEGSYTLGDFDPLMDAGLVDLLDGDMQVTPCVRVVQTDAHCPGHQIVWVESGTERLLVAAEILPSSWHLRLSWVMSYDQNPVDVVEWKRRLMQEAEETNAIVLLGHDPNETFGRLRRRSAREYMWQPLE